MLFDQSINLDKTSFPAQSCEQDGHLSEAQNPKKYVTVINEGKAHVRKVNQDAPACSSCYQKELEPRTPRGNFRTCKNYSWLYIINWMQIFHGPWTRTVLGYLLTRTHRKL